MTIKAQILKKSLDSLSQAVFLITLVSCAFLLTGFTFYDYPTATMAEALAERPRPGDGPGVWYAAEKVPFRMELVYTGEIRPIPPEKTEQIKGWLVGTHQDPAMAELFRREVKATENGTPYWLSVPEPVLLNLERQVHPGDPVGFYLDWIGTTRTEHVFIVGIFAR